MEQHGKTQIPGFEMMLKPILYALDNLGGKASIQSLDTKTIEIMGIPHSVASIPHGHGRDRTEVSYRMAWARTYLKKYGLINNTSRGEWSFSKTFDRSNIDILEPSEITQSVRNSSLGVFNNPNISNLESHQAFEKFATAVLADYLERQNKALEISSIFDDKPYDLFLPSGLDGFDKPTYVVIKYTQASENAYIRIVQSICESFSSSIKNAGDTRLMFILGTILTNKKKDYLISMAQSHVRSEVVIWDYSDLEELANPESRYIDYWVDPRKALVEEAILTKSSGDEQREQKKEIIELLNKAYQNENITLFLGAGISIDAGIPLWSELINKLLFQMINEKTDGKRLTKADLDFINNLAYSNKEDSPLTQMRYIKEAFTSNKYYQLVHKALYSNKIRTKTDLLNAIIYISTPRRNHIGVRSIVTYNFDNLLESAFKNNKIDYHVVYREADFAVSDSLNIYHVHGYLPQKLADEISSTEMNLVFSEEDYHKVYRDAYCWSNLIQLNAFRDTSCLFIGCSLTDPNLRRLLDVAARQDESPRHFAILKRKNYDAKDLTVAKKHLVEIYENIDNNIRQSYFQSLGLSIIWIDDYSEIPAILTELNHK